MSKKFTIRDIVIIGMLAAFCTIGTTIKIPYGNGAMVHLGSAAIYTTGLLFGGIYAGFGGAIGSAFFDLLMGFSPYTLWSFFIKGLAGYIVGSIAHSDGADGKSFIRNLIAIIVGAVWTLIGYLAAWTAVIGKFEAALLNIPSSIITSAVGAAVALPLAAALYKPIRKLNA